jgi:hypothetical protein
MAGTEVFYSRNPGYAMASLGEEIAVLDLDGGSYLGLNVTASAVWRLLGVPQTLETLCSHLTDRFAVDKNHCKAAVLTLVTRLCEAGLLRKTHEPAA